MRGIGYGVMGIASIAAAASLAAHARPAFGSYRGTFGDAPNRNPVCGIEMGLFSGRLPGERSHGRLREYRPTGNKRQRRRRRSV